MVEVRLSGWPPFAVQPCGVGGTPWMVRFERLVIRIGPKQTPCTSMVAPLGAVLIAVWRFVKVVFGIVLTFTWHGARFAWMLLPQVPQAGSFDAFLKTHVPLPLH